MTVLLLVVSTFAGCTGGDPDSDGFDWQDGNFVLTRMADIYSGSSGSNPGEYSGVTVMGTGLYFDANDGSSGIELWAHETTNDSTWQVADINSGTGHSIPRGVTVMGTRLYFSAFDINSGNELWAHETINSSTWQVADINSGGGSSGPGYYSGLTVMGTRLYFNANDGSSGGCQGSWFLPDCHFELWAHESTNDSTWQVADINSGNGSSSPAHYAGLTVMGTRLYFDADDGSSGRELWAHETTNSSTWQVADINSGSSGSNPGNCAGLTVMGARLYFDADDGSSGRELWAHETTNDSTWQVADINNAPYGGSNPGVNYGGDGVTVMGTRLYFDADDGSYGSELWAHETINSSTWQVADINSGGSSSFPKGLTVMGTRLYFDADDGSYGSELWAHETINSSTWQVTRISALDHGAFMPGIYSELMVMGTRLYFDAFSGRELWVHETRNDSTWLVANINNAPYGRSDPGYYSGFTVMGTRLYFDAKDDSSGRELWRLEIERTTTYN